MAKIIRIVDREKRTPKPKDISKTVDVWRDYFSIITQEKLDNNELTIPEKYFKKYNDNYTEAEKAFIFDEQCRLTKEFYKTIDEEKEKDKHLLSKSFKDSWPPSWAIRDKRIREMRRKFRFDDFNNYLRSQATSAVSYKLGKILPKELNKNYVLIQIDAEKAAEKLDMSKWTFYKYREAFLKIGIIKDLGRWGEKENNHIMAIGNWQTYPTKRKLWFLKETPEWKEKLRNFSLHEPKNK
jgi:hypothetical protein